MRYAMDNPKRGLVLRDVQMADQRWPASEGWEKVAINYRGVEIHFVRNRLSGAVDDFKFPR